MKDFLLEGVLGLDLDYRSGVSASGFEWEMILVTLDCVDVDKVMKFPISFFGVDMDKVRGRVVGDRLRILCKLVSKESGGRYFLNLNGISVEYLGKEDGGGISDEVRDLGIPGDDDDADSFVPQSDDLPF